MKRLIVLIFFCYFLSIPIMASAANPEISTSPPFARLNGKGLTLTMLPEGADSVLDMDPLPAPAVLSSEMPAVLSFPAWEDADRSMSYCSIALWRMTDSGPALMNGFLFRSQNKLFTFPHLENGLYGITLLEDTVNFEYHGRPVPRRGFLLRVGEGETAKPESQGPLPSYFPYILQPDSSAYYLLNAALTREDLGVTVQLESGQANQGEINCMACVRLLTDLDLGPWNPQAPPLPIEKPFTVTLKFGRQTDVFRFTPAGVFSRGVLYTPQVPEALLSFYGREGLDRILTARIFTLGSLVDFGPNDVKTLRTSAGGPGFSESFSFSDPEIAARFLNELKKLAVRMPILEAGWNDPLFTGCSAIWHSWEFQLKNGETRRFMSCANRYNYNGPTAPTDEMGAVGAHSKFFSMMDELRYYAESVALPNMRFIVNGSSTWGELRQFEWNGVSAEWINNSAGVVKIKEEANARCAFAFTDSQGRLLIPETVRVEMTRQLIGQGKPNLTTTVEAPDGKMLLPAKPGTYCLVVTATFPEGHVTYVTNYRVSDIAERLYRFDYDKYNVSIVWQDDRPTSYMRNNDCRAFLAELVLSPDIRTPLPIETPFTINFDDEENQMSFSFTKEGVEIDGQLYGTMNPEALKLLEDKTTKGGVAP